MKINCITCGALVETTRKDKKYCKECARKRNIQSVLRARKKPSLKGEVLGYINQGFYNIISSISISP